MAVFDTNLKCFVHAIDLGPLQPGQQGQPKFFFRCADNLFVFVTEINAGYSSKVGKFSKVLHDILKTVRSVDNNRNKNSRNLLIDFPLD